MWRVEDFKKVEVSPDKYGQFYAGDSYVLLYTYNDARGKEQYIIYFWQGKDSSKDEVDLAAGGKEGGWREGQKEKDTCCCCCYGLCKCCCCS